MILGIELLLVHISLLKLSDQGMITLPHQEIQLGLVLLQFAANALSCWLC
jgi:hypothetical protein